MKLKSIKPKLIIMYKQLCEQEQIKDAKYLEISQEGT